MNPIRISYDGLQALWQRLFDRWLAGDMSDDEYNVEMDRIAKFAGWTWDEVLSAIDERWTTKASPAQSVMLC